MTLLDEQTHPNPYLSDLVSECVRQVHDSTERALRSEWRFTRVAWHLGPARCRELAGQIRLDAIADETWPTIAASATDAANALLGQAILMEDLSSDGRPVLVASVIAAAGFTPGDRVRIVDQPRSITPLQAGRHGTFLGPQLVDDSLVYVALDSGSHWVADVQIMLRAFDLEAVAE